MTDDELVEASYSAPCPVKIAGRHSGQPLWLIGVVEGRRGGLHAVLESTDGIVGVLPHAFMSVDYNTCGQM